MADKVVKLQPDDLTPMQRLAQLAKEQAELTTTIKEAALKKGSEVIDELKSIGLDYELKEKSLVATAARRGFAADAACTVCGFKTTPPHDKRTHKKHPEAFTDEELRARNLVRVN